MKRNEEKTKKEIEEDLKMTQCEFSDLPVDACAHCQGQLKKPTKAKAIHSIESRYASGCLVCGDWIKVGDPIYLIPVEPLYFSDPPDGKEVPDKPTVWVCGACGEK